jgi:hypothetical protein
MRGDTVLNAYRKRSALLTKRAPEVPALQPGTEQIRHEFVGKEVHLTAGAMYKEGTPAIITKAWEENGYARYMCEYVWIRKGKKNTSIFIAKSTDIQEMQ